MTTTRLTRQGVQRREMLRLLLENGRPRILSLADQLVKPQDSFLIIIPLNQQKENQS
jgi:hypothetical protein